MPKAGYHVMGVEVGCCSMPCEWAPIREWNHDLQRLLHRRQFHAVPGRGSGRIDHGYRAIQDGGRAGTLRDRLLRALADRADLVPDDERTAASRLSEPDARSRGSRVKPMSVRGMFPVNQRPVSASSLAWVESSEGAVAGPKTPADLQSSALPFRSE